MVPAVAFAVNTAGLFAHTSEEAGVAVMVGVRPTDTVVTVVLVPQLLVPVTVYTVVAVGVTTIDEVVALVLQA